MPVWFSITVVGGVRFAVLYYLYIYGYNMLNEVNAPQPKNAAAVTAHFFRNNENIASFYWFR